MDAVLIEQALARVEHLGSQQRKADEIGVSDSTVRRWLNGDRGPLTQPTREALRGYLTIPQSTPTTPSEVEAAFWEIAAIVERVKKSPGPIPHPSDMRSGKAKDAS